LRQLSARDVTRFLHRYCQHFSKGRAKLLVTALRSFLRYALVKGLITNDLVPCVPTVAYWKRSGLPKAIPKSQVKRILHSSDHRTSIGRRDYAVVLVLARLGLRCHEVVLMTLDDIDWAQGEITVRGKGRRSDRLPIPDDVGTAIAAYLRRGRPHCATRRLFVRDRAPYEGFSSSTAVGDILRRAAARAGLDPSGLGPHRLRHSVATEMLRHGATLQEISEILRHRHADTTAIYAKVDLVALRQLAQPWPGARR
jgi:site-specific recombinase XerD